MIFFNPYKDIVIVCGHYQSGKSNFVKYLIRHLPVSLAVYDVIHQYTKTCQPVLSLTYLRPNPPNTLVKQAYQVQGIEDTELENFLKVCWNHPNQAIIIEEANQHFTNSPFGLKGWKGKTVNQAANLGKCLIFVTRRVGDLHAQITSQAKIVSFRQFRKKDLDRLGEDIENFNPDDVKNLEPYHFIYWNGKTYAKHTPVPLGD